VAGFRTGTISIGFSGWTATGVPPRSAVKQHGDPILITPFDKAVVPALVRALNDAAPSRVLDVRREHVALPELDAWIQWLSLLHLRSLGHITT